MRGQAPQAPRGRVLEEALLIALAGDREERPGLPELTMFSGFSCILPDGHGAHGCNQCMVGDMPTAHVMAAVARIRGGLAVIIEAMVRMVARWCTC